MKMALANPLVNVFLYHQLLAERLGKDGSNILQVSSPLAREHGKLTLPANSPACSNSKSHPDPWLTNPVRRYAQAHMSVSFLEQLETLCCAAQVRECKNPDCYTMYKIMNEAAPPCSWQAFRHWALVVMSCQDQLAQSLRRDLAEHTNGSKVLVQVDKMVRGHTHLVNVIHACQGVLATVRRNLEAQMWQTRDGGAGPAQDLAGVCNIIYWMVNSLSFQHLGMGLLTLWDHYYLPPSISTLAIRDATQRALTLQLCSHRFWNLVDVAERKQSDLPDIVDRLDRAPRQTALQHVKHDDCVPTKCNFSHINSTKVRQLHKCEFGECDQDQYPVEDIAMALELGIGTAWSTREPELSAPDTPYVAISHVWADGTGVGLTDDMQGSVNSCLFAYFKRVAERLDCEGIWWDTLSIPSERRSRAKALAIMHKNYSDAKYTIVHDRYLLDISCTDPETACVAIVLSPWFTRGWTALELRMATHVKVLFKGNDSQTPDIKDLDQDLLAKRPGPVSRLHWLATTIIRRLRTCAVEYVEDILGILKPRYTSWVRDRAIIAGLLVGVPRCDYSRNEGNITRDIITYLGYVSYSSLLHGRSTMFETGSFSWCPTTLEEMPIDSSSTDWTSDRDKRQARMLRVQDGAVVGKWYCKPVTERQIKGGEIQPHGDHLSVNVRFYNALLDWKNCVILRQHAQGLGLSLLAMTLRTGEEHGKPLIDCQYVGAARISQLGHLAASKDDQAGDNDLACHIMVRIGYKTDDNLACRSRDAIKEYFGELRKGSNGPLPDASPPEESQKSQDETGFEKGNQHHSSSDNEDSAVTQRELVLEAFRSPHAAELLHLFIFLEVDISDDIKAGLSFEQLCLLSSVYLENEHQDEARTACQDAMTKLSVTPPLGDIPPRNAMCVLGKIFWKIGLLEEAICVYKHLIDSCDGSIAPVRRLQAQALGELCLVYFQRGQMADALSCYQRAVRCMAKVPSGVNEAPSEAYVFTYDTVRRLGWPYWEKHAQDQAAEAAYKESLSIFEKQVGNKHAITLITAQNLAGTCLGLGDIGSAEEMLNDVVLGLSDIAGPNHELTLRAQFDLYRVYILQGRLTKPDLMAVLLGKCKSHLHQQHWLTQLVLLTIGKLHVSTGQFEIAIETLETSTTPGSQDSTDACIYLAACASRELGIAHAMLGDLKSAATYFCEARERLQDHGLGEHLESYIALYCLATIKDAHGYAEKAGQMFRDALTGMEKLCGPTDPETREAVTKLAQLCKARVCAEDDANDDDLDPEDHVAGKEHILCAIYRLRELLNRCGDLPGSKGRIIRAFSGYEAVFKTADKLEMLRVDQEDSEYDVKLEKGEIVVKNAAIAIRSIRDEEPFVVADDVVGTVVRVGEGDARFQLGDPVLGLAISSATGELRHTGFRAFTVVPSQLAARVPPHLSAAEAAVLPLGVARAAAALFHRRHLGLELPSLHRKERRNNNQTHERPHLLVWDGATSPGCDAIQLAVAAGYEVIATSLPKDFDYVKTLGARHAVHSNPALAEDGLLTAFAVRHSIGAFDTVGSAETKRACARVMGQAKVVVASDVAAPGLGDVDPFIFEEFLGRALAEKKYIPAPDHTRTPLGPGALKFALEMQKKVVVMV